MTEHTPFIPKIFFKCFMSADTSEPLDIDRPTDLILGPKQSLFYNLSTKMNF